MFGYSFKDGGADAYTADWAMTRAQEKDAFERFIDFVMKRLRKILDTYIETEPAPTLQQGDVVILDNFSSHKSAKAEAALRQRGAWFLFLPPYSPDLNPIEMAFAKLKAHLRRIGARTIDTLCRAIDDISALYSQQQCWNYLKDAGYSIEP